MKRRTAPMLQTTLWGQQYWTDDHPNGFTVKGPLIIQYINITYLGNLTKGIRGKPHPSKVIDPFGRLQASLVYQGERVESFLNIPFSALLQAYRHRRWQNSYGIELDAASISLRRATATISIPIQTLYKMIGQPIAGLMLREGDSALIVPPKPSNSFDLMGCEVTVVSTGLRIEDATYLYSAAQAIDLDPKVAEEDGR